MNYTEIGAQLLVVIGGLVILVNIITEVIKRCHKFKKEGSINIFVSILSVVLTVLSFLAYWQWKSLMITWYVIVAFIVIGFMVAYGAMLGFDKLIKQLKKMNE